jgi:hypothetical protein
MADDTGAAMSCLPHACGCRPPEGHGGKQWWDGFKERDVEVAQLEARAHALRGALHTAKSWLVSATYKAPEQNPALYFAEALKVIDAALAREKE